MRLNMVVALLSVSILLLTGLVSGESQLKPSQPAVMSDRDKASLRGSVKTCQTETIYSGFEQTTTSNDTTEYSVDGRLLRRSTRSGAYPEQVVINSYDYKGRLTESITGAATSPLSERRRTAYSYDKDGRLVSISGGPDSLPGEVQYDDKGRRIERQRLPELSDSRTVAVGATMWQDSGIGLSTLPGGTYEVVFSENGQPIEGRMLDRNGRVLETVVRTLDSHGRPLSDDLKSEAGPDTLPAELTSEMNPEQRKSLAAFWASKMNGHTEYKYDAEGRLIERRRSLGLFGDEITTIAYNEHNDKTLERTAAAQNPELGIEYGMDDAGKMIPVKKSPVPPPNVNETHYEYVYDSNGNWIEQKVFHSTVDGASPEPTEVVRRTIAYY